MRNPEAQFRQPPQGHSCLSASRSVDLQAWALALLLLTAGNPSLAQDPQTTAPPPEAPAADRHQPPRSEMPWLDEVRTQRQAWEDRRQAARDAFEARRRLADPQGAAHKETWENDVRRRREARMQRIEQDRQRFRALGQPPHPWYTPRQAGVPDAAGGGQGERSSQPTVAPHPDAWGQDTGTLSDPLMAPQREPHLPQTWDNNWYYRGY